MHRGALWARLRQGAHPMFHSQALASYGQTINTALEQMFSNLQSAATSNAQVDVLQQVSAMIMQVIGVAAFG